MRMCGGARVSFHTVCLIFAPMTHKGDSGKWHRRYLLEEFRPFQSAQLPVSSAAKRGTLQESVHDTAPDSCCSEALAAAIVLKGDRPVTSARHADSACEWSAASALVKCAAVR